MGAVAPFIPQIISGGGALAAGLLGRNIGGPSGKEKGLQDKQAGAIGQLGQLGGNLSQFGQRNLNNASSFYNTILSGSRGAQNQLLQPEIAGITDTFRGAERNLTRSGVRGGSRDVAKAELGRDRANRIAGLIPGLRPGAASAVGQLGQFGAGTGAQALSGTASGYGQLLAGMRDDRRISNEQGGMFGEGVGNILADVMKTQGSKGKGKGGGTSLPPPS